MPAPQPAHRSSATTVCPAPGKQAASYKQCTLLGVTPNEKKRGTWTGMVTSLPDCEIGGPPEKEGDPPIPFYIFKPKQEGCQEIWEGDLARRQGGGDGSGQGGEGTDEPSPTGEGGAGQPLSKKKADDGCGCSVPGAPTGSVGLAGLSLLAALLRRRRRG